MMKNLDPKLQSGFTLIELILYIALVTMMMSALIPFAWTVIEGSVKVNTEQEVYSQARFLGETLKRAIRDSSSITTCNGTTLTIVHPVAAQNPTTFTFSSNAITVTSGTAIPTAVRLHSADTRITAFNCTEYSSTNNESAQITFTIASNYANTNRNEYSETLNIQFSAEARE